MSRPRAPQTIHLRKLISKASRRRPTNLSSKRPAIEAGDIALNEVRSAHCHVVRRTTSPSPALLEQLSTVCTQTPAHLSPTSTGQPDENMETLCEILAHLASEFKNQGRFYSAMGATAAIALVRNGRQDEINSGLWPYIVRIEKARELKKK